MRRRWEVGGEEPSEGFQSHFGELKRTRDGAESLGVGLENRRCAKNADTRTERDKASEERRSEGRERGKIRSRIR